MNFNIASVGPTPPSGPPVRGTAPPRAANTGALEHGDAVRVETIPSSPPPEVLHEMSTAAGAYDRLAAAGQALHFKVDGTTGKLHVEVHDVHGNLLFSVPASKALDVAAGGGL
jgi:hypothetical protein